MPAKSEKQRKMMGMALAAKRGEMKHPPAMAKKMAAGMSEGKLEAFAMKVKDGSREREEKMLGCKQVFKGR